MKVVYLTEHPYVSMSSRSVQTAKKAVAHGVRAVVLSLAAIGALDLIGASAFESSTAAMPQYERGAAFEQPFVYFPSQFVNSATQREEWIEQF
ncbi:MAG TPA: hypothetical protein VFH67_03480 [bacterium]|nr:hypothetical protein [bacterium]